MLNIEFLPGVLEVIYSVFHFFQVRVNLSPVLVIDIYNFDEAFFKQKSLFLRLDAWMIQTIALFVEALTTTIPGNGYPAFFFVLDCILSMPTLWFRNSHWLGRYVWISWYCHRLQLCLHSGASSFPLGHLILHAVKKWSELLLDDFKVIGGFLSHVLNWVPGIGLDHYVLTIHVSVIRYRVLDYCLDERAQLCAKLVGHELHLF